MFTLIVYIFHILLWRQTILMKRFLAYFLVYSSEFFTNSSSIFCNYTRKYDFSRESFKLQSKVFMLNLRCEKPRWQTISVPNKKEEATNRCLFEYLYWSHVFNFDFISFYQQLLVTKKKNGKIVVPMLTRK